MLILGLHYLPQKREVLHPSTSNVTTLYADESWGGKSSATWIDANKFHWRCNLVQSEFYPVCGMAISFLGKNSKTIDFSQYEAIHFTIHYKGEAQKIRVYLRNHNPSYSDTSDADSYKFNAISLRAKDFNQGITKIKLSEFSVADWWLEERDIPRELSAPELDNIIAMGIDFPLPHTFGQHDINVDKIELVGNWISAENFYLAIIVFWIAVLGLEVGCKIFIAYRNKPSKSKTDRSDLAAAGRQPEMLGKGEKTLDDQAD